MPIAQGYPLSLDDPLVLHPPAPGKGRNVLPERVEDAQRQGVDLPDIHERTVAAPVQELGGAGAAGGHDRDAAGQCLQQNVAESFPSRWQHKQRSAPKIG